MSVPLFDLKRLLKKHNNDLTKALQGCLEHGKFIMGPEVEEFEQAFSRDIGAKHVISSSSGTDALLSIFMALDVEPGSEVLVPSFTFIASASSIIRAGLKPVFVDLAPDSFHPSCETIRKAWTEKTVGVLFVHLFGEPEDLSDVKKLCNDRGAFLIEDCAQSYGSTAGGSGLASAYSFFPAKNLGCLGDGGAVSTESDSFAEKIKTIRTHGSKVKYNYELLGGNFRMDTVQAAFLLTLIQSGADWVKKRRENAAYYSDFLKNTGDIQLPKDCPGHSWNQYTIRTRFRDDLKAHLESLGIGCSVYYPIPLHNSVSIFGESESLPQTDLRCSEVLSIPVYPGLEESERELVVSVVKEFFE